jgi:hypothetical protein
MKYSNFVVLLNFLCCATPPWIHVQNYCCSLSAVILASTLYPSSYPQLHHPQKVLKCINS